MTFKELSEYIYSKQIPLKFVWVDNETYYFKCWFNNLYITSHKSDMNTVFPETNSYHSDSIEICFRRTKYNVNIFEYYKNNVTTIEQCISEFLYWFELNKHKCKSITYYEK